MGHDRIGRATRCSAPRHAEACLPRVSGAKAGLPECGARWTLRDFNVTFKQVLLGTRYSFQANRPLAGTGLHRGSVSTARYIGAEYSWSELGRGIAACSHLVERVQRQHRMRRRRARTHLCGHPDGFHDLFRRCPLLARRLGMTADAIWALGHMCDRNGDQLFRLARQCALFEDGLAELLEGSVDLRGERTAPLRYRLARLRAESFGHGTSCRPDVMGEHHQPV